MQHVPRLPIEFALWKPPQDQPFNAVTSAVSVEIRPSHFFLTEKEFCKRQLLRTSGIRIPSFQEEFQPQHRGLGGNHSQVIEVRGLRRRYAIWLTKGIKKSKDSAFHLGWRRVLFFRKQNEMQYEIPWDLGRWSIPNGEGKRRNEGGFKSQRGKGCEPVSGTSCNVPLEAAAGRRSKFWKKGVKGVLKDESLSPSTSARPLPDSSFERSGTRAAPVKYESRVACHGTCASCATAKITSRNLVQGY